MTVNAVRLPGIECGRTETAQDVFLESHNSQMRWVNTTGISTNMVDVISRTQSRPKKLPNESVSKNQPSIAINSGIPVFVESHCPLPTFRRITNHNPLPHIIYVGLSRFFSILNRALSTDSLNMGPVIRFCFPRFPAYLALGKKKEAILAKSFNNCGPSHHYIRPYRNNGVNVLCP